MLQIAKKKTERKKLSHQINIVAGDAESIPFEDNTFDAESIAFVIRNCQNYQQGLREAFRVLKPGGRLFILEFSVPEPRPIRFLYGLYFNNLLPIIGRIISKDHNAYRYLPQSVYAFPQPDTFINTMCHVGFQNVARLRLSFGIAGLFEGEKPSL